MAQSVRSTMTAGYFSAVRLCHCTTCSIRTSMSRRLAVPGISIDPRMRGLPAARIDVPSSLACRTIGSCVPRPDFSSAMRGCPGGRVEAFAVAIRGQEDVILHAGVYGLDIGQIDVY